MTSLSKTMISRVGSSVVNSGRSVRCNGEMHALRLANGKTGTRSIGSSSIPFSLKTQMSSHDSFEMRVDLATQRRKFHKTACRLRDDRDPGGKPIPTDGSYRTVYDDFTNILASDDPQLSVRSMGESNFTLSDGLVCRTGIILMQKQVLLWDPPLLANEKDSNSIVMPSGVGWEDWTDDVWKIFEMASPRPEIIIFGTGKTVLPPPLKVRKYLNNLGIQIEAHNTRNACSTYNLLNEEQRMVAAALLPNVRKPNKRIKATQRP